MLPQMQFLDIFLLLINLRKDHETQIVFLKDAMLM
jgi:hypothetical protein